MTIQPFELYMTIQVKSFFFVFIFINLINYKLKVKINQKVLQFEQTYYIYQNLYIQRIHFDL